MGQGPISSPRDTYLSLWVLLQGFPCDSAGKESTCSAGDLGSVPGLERSPGEGKGHLLQYSGLQNSVDCRVQGVGKSRTRLGNFHDSKKQVLRPPPRHRVAISARAQDSWNNILLPPVKIGGTNQSEQSLHAVDHYRHSDSYPNDSPFRKLHGWAESSELIFRYKWAFSPGCWVGSNLPFSNQHLPLGYWLLDGKQHFGNTMAGVLSVVSED